LEGVDYFILSHETLIGLNPVKAMDNLAKAIAEAENIYDFD
jgi:pyruvate kinase